MDSEHLFEEQDLRIADLVEREGRALVVAISKWDLAERRAGGITKLHEEVDERLPQVKGVPVVGVSGLTGEGLDRLMAADRRHSRGVEQARLDQPAQQMARGRHRRRIRRRRCRDGASGSTT